MNRLKTLIILVLCLMASFANHTFANDVLDIRLSGNKQKTRLVIELDQQVAFKVYNISEPERLIVDFDVARFKIPANSGLQPYGLIKEYRYGNFSPTKSRIVLDTIGKTNVVAAFIVPPQESKGALLVVDIVTKDQQPSKNQQQLNEANVNRNQKQDLSPNSQDGFDASLTADPKTVQLEFQPNIPSIDELIDFQPDIPSIDELMRTANNANHSNQPIFLDEQADIAEQSENSKGSNLKQTKIDLSSLYTDISQAPKVDDAQSSDNKMRIKVAVPKPIKRPKNYQQIILASRNIAKKNTQIKPSPTKRRKPIIVLDAGHGGIDGGTVSLRGTREKNVVLAFAKRLQKKLVASGKYKVYLTRKGDYFIKLRDRVKISQKHKADLFISLHADSVPGRNSSARGASIYTLSDKASDKEAAALARKENKSDIVAGVQFKNESKVVVSILIDLAQRDTKSKSIKFANYTARSMKGNVLVHKRPIKFGNLRVLKAPDIPSVLIELGYLSNRNDERNLKSANWQNKMATSIMQSVNKYFKNRRLF